VSDCEAIGDPLDIAVMFDAPEENWPSMDLAGEMLFDQWREDRSLGVTPTRIAIRIPSIVRRLAGAGSAAFNADRALARYLAYPLRSFAARRPGRFFHVVDHSYAQLVHALPGRRTGVYCHDLDAFRALWSPASDGAASPRKALAYVLLRGLQAAAVVFYSTRDVGRELEDRGLVPRERLVLAPYGVGPEFNEHRAKDSHADVVLSSLRGRPFLLHVGSGIPRKRLDVLFEVFARVRAGHPELRLVQQGAALSPAQRAHVDRLGIGDALLQPPKVDRTTLAEMYRRASLVLVTSESEGFGFPVVEALACGATVLCSDLPVLREVGGAAALYAPAGDVSAWSATVTAILDGAGAQPPKAARLARARSFTWRGHARTLRDAYASLRDQRGAPATDSKKSR
jgi:glycosyltransferase involved in cell wall biosynthesis